jgi:hypothetical protein
MNFIERVMYFIVTASIALLACIAIKMFQKKAGAM